MWVAPFLKACQQSLLTRQQVVHSIRTRLAALRKKMQIISKRTSAAQAPAAPSAVASNPAAAGTPPR